MKELVLHKKALKHQKKVLSSSCCCCDLIYFVLEIYLKKKKKKHRLCPPWHFPKEDFHFLASHTWPPAANVSPFWSLFPPLSLGRGGGTANGQVLSVVGKCQEASWISLMKEDHWVSRSPRAQIQVLLHFKGSAEKYQYQYFSNAPSEVSKQRQRLQTPAESGVIEMQRKATIFTQRLVSRRSEGHGWSP